jgi:hypothetical protein
MHWHNRQIKNIYEMLLMYWMFVMMAICIASQQVFFNAKIENLKIIISNLQEMNEKQNNEIKKINNNYTHEITVADLVDRVLKNK